jgi:hypothetical protein
MFVITTYQAPGTHKYERTTRKAATAHIRLSLASLQIVVLTGHTLCPLQVALIRGHVADSHQQTSILQIIAVSLEIRFYWRYYSDTSANEDNSFRNHIR